MQLTKVKTYSAIPLSKIKPHLRTNADDTTLNEIIQDYIESAIDEAEKFCRNRDFAQTVTTIVKDATTLTPFVILDYRINQPNIAISGITLTDWNNNVTPITAYQVERFNTYTKLWFNPTITAKQLTIVYTSGYSNYKDYPKGVLEAIRDKVKEYLDGDEAKIFARVLSPYVI